MAGAEPSAIAERRGQPTRRFACELSPNLSRDTLRNIFSNDFRDIVPTVVVARTMAVAELRPASVRVLAAVEATALGATVIGGWYLADGTFGT